MKKSNIILTLFLALSFTLQAQLTLERTLIGSSGDHAQSGSLELSSSLGEVAVEYSLSGSLSLSQGFQQGYASGQTGLEAPSISLDYEVFPNPTEGPLVVRLQSSHPLDLRLEVFDLKGRAVGISSPSLRVSSQPFRQQLELGGLSAGTYVLRLLHEGNSLKVFRIQKK